MNSWFSFYLRTGYVKREHLTFTAICCWLHLVTVQKPNPSVSRAGGRARLEITGDSDIAPSSKALRQKRK